MNLDARTLLVIGGFGCWILAAAFEILSLRTERERRYPDRWTFGLLTQGLGLNLISQRGLIPDLWSISLANLLLLLTPLFFYSALQRVRGVDTSRFLIGVVPVGVGVVLPIIGFSDEQFAARAIVILCASLFGLGLSLWSAAQIARTGYLLGASLILVPGALLALFFIVFVLSAVHSQIRGVFSDGDVARAFYAMNDIAILLSTLGYMNICSIAGRQLRKIDGLVRADGRAGLCNAAALLKRGTEELLRARRRGHPVCVLAIRIDGFDALKMSHGNAFATNALSRVAALALKSVRAYDLVGRTSGSLLGVVMPELPLAAGLEAAERIRSSVANRPDSVVGAPRIKVSIGLCEVRDTQENLETVLAVAAGYLARAQREGGNRIVTSQPARGIFQEMV